MNAVTVTTWVMAGLAAAGASVGICWVLHRFCIRLEEAGYLYYRKPNAGGGGGGVFQELDRLTRPSVEHVMQVQDETKQQEERIGGE